MYRKLVAIRSTNNLFMLEKALAETDPETTGVVVMTAKVAPIGDSQVDRLDLDRYDQQLMTAVVQRAERAGKEVKPLIVPTNNPLFAVIKTAKDIQAHELIMGASNKYTADEQLEQIGFYWISMHHGDPAPLTVRILGRNRDVHLDLGGGNRIPKVSERKARSVAELRAAGVGVDHVLMVHDGSPASSDLFQAVLTMLDLQVALSVVPLVPPGNEPLNGHGLIQQDRERAQQLDRELHIHEVNKSNAAAEIVELAHNNQVDLIILPLLHEAMPATPTLPLDPQTSHIVRNAHCRVFLAAPPAIPQEPEAN
jgi:nucleotide-binding universal stress UspA family protein